MTWTAALVIVPGVCYAAAALAFCFMQDWPRAIIFSGYAWANVGLWWLDVVLAK